MTPVSVHSVPFFVYPHVFTSQDQDLLRIFCDVGRRGAFIMQRDLADFERHLAELLGAQHALGVGNATDGLNFAVRAANIGRPGDEVILSSHTMIATAAAVHFAGGTPVPVECGADHLIDPAAVEAAVTARTRAIIPTQLNGRTCNMDALQAVADRHGLLIIEDAAQALGSRHKGRCAGTFGIAAAISFYPAKLLGCLGDGGAVITNDDAIYERAYQMRDHGRNREGQIVSWGVNSRLDNLQAALLDFQLKRYEGVIARRRKIATLYTERLSTVPEVVLPPPPDSDPDHFDIYQNYEIEAEKRNELKEYLKDHGIGTLIQWGGQAVHHLKALGFTQHLPYTDRLFTRMLMLPMNMSLADDDIHYVSDNIRAFYGCKP
ncbi:MAG: DegT/DnrJ/EryC1/StrS family aminotransferase [Acidobacteriia bacterium]|nr:DegT/DnrJ/EryC1/StrS family aminotransferase [Terriglobia bacterium]